MSNVFSDPIVLSTVIIACATVVNVLVSTLLWLVTRRSVKIAEQMFLTQQRPFVGVAGWTFESDPITRRISIGVKFQNFGSIPARKFYANLEVYIDKLSIQINKMEVNPSTLFPNVLSTIRASMVQSKKFESIISWVVPFEIVFKATYQGVGDLKYETYERARFMAHAGGFVALDGNWK